MGFGDSRLVKVAVLGSRTSDQPVILPTAHDDALRLKKRFGSDAFWCGSLLGGCGGILTVRICHGKVSHFAHRPGEVCIRRRTDEDSADHLYLHREVGRWLDKCGLDHRLELRRQTNEDWTSLDVFLPSPGLRLRFYCSYAEGTLPQSAVEFALSGTYDDVLLGEHTPVPRELFARRGHVLRLRMVSDRREDLWHRRIQVGTELPARRTVWRNLDECWITPRGVMTPVAAKSAPEGSVVERYRQPTPFHAARHQAVVTEGAPRRRGPAGPITPWQEAVFVLRDYLRHCAAHGETTTWDDLAGITRLDLRAFGDTRCQVLLGAVDAATPLSEPPLFLLVRRGNGRPLPYLGELAKQLGRSIPPGHARHKWCEEQTRRLFALHKAARTSGGDVRLDSVRRSLKRIGTLLARAQDQLDFAGKPEHRALVKAMRHARSWQDQWQGAGRRGVAHRTWWAGREGNEITGAVALEQAIQRSGAVLEAVQRRLIEAACHGDTITVADLFGPQGCAAPSPPPAGLVRTLIRAEGAVTDQVPVLSALITTDGGDPPSEARDILAGLGFVRPVSDEVLRIVWRHEQQRSWAAHATPPTEMPPRRIPRSSRGSR
ncbi:competence protein CoiA family protein [Streptomyces sp. NPDC013953]|uniref:competence protein CoiA family protein n=1 Tax=Streptomyces sp. NPDC013953 TaxID=3364868 RepID=UPI0036F64E1C